MRRELAIFACVLGVLCSGCDSTNKADDKDQADARQVAAGIGVQADVSCHADKCLISWKAPVHDRDEAWVIALPIVTWVDGDPNLRHIRALGLKIDDSYRRTSTRLSCFLPHVLGQKVVRPKTLRAWCTIEAVPTTG
jgi:hypothetical protein